MEQEVKPVEQGGAAAPAEVAAPAANTEPAANPAPAPVPAEQQKTEQAPAADAGKPEEKFTPEQSAKALVEELNSLFDAVEKKKTEAAKADPTGFVEKKVEKAATLPAAKQEVKDEEDYKSKFETFSKESEVKLGELNKQVEELNQYKTGVESLWEEAAKHPVIGKAVEAWLEGKDSGKELPANDGLAKLIEAYVSGKDIDVSRLVDSSKSNEQTALPSTSGVPPQTKPKEVSFQESIESAATPRRSTFF